MKKKCVGFCLLFTLCALTCLFIVLASSSVVSAKTLTVSEPTEIEYIDGNDYYVIRTINQLAYIGEEGGDWLNKRYILEDDLVLNEETLASNENGDVLFDTDDLYEWTTIESVSELKGNGHTISGIYINSTEDYQGLFKYASKVSDLKIENSYISGANYVGGLIAFPDSSALTNCSFSGTVRGTGDKVGGLCGWWAHGSTLTNCSAEGYVKGYGSYTGGLVGYSSSITVKQCVNNCVVNGVSYVGGIAGCADVTLIGLSENNGKIYGSGDYVGGIAGRAGMLLRDKNTGNVEGHNYVGGIVGDPTGKTTYVNSSPHVTLCRNTGNVKGYDYVGGCVGNDAASTYNKECAVSFSSNEGDVSGSQYVGGIIGYVTRLNVASCYNVGNVSGYSTETGNIAGYSGTVLTMGTASSCYYIENKNNYTAFGNGDDANGSVEAKPASFFCYAGDTVSSHTSSSKTTVVEATCEEEGQVQYVCSVCNETITETVSATGHTWNTEYTTDVEATCTTSGIKSIHCLTCGKSDETTTEEIPATGHEYDEGVVTVPTTCTEDGIKTFTCVKGDNSYTETIKATGHTWNTEYTVDVAATCTEAGSKSIHCVTCDAVKEDSEEEIPAAGHTWSPEYTVETEARCETPGMKDIRCEVCGVVKDGSEEEIPATGHIYDEGVVTTKPTCVLTGTKTYTCVYGDSTKTEEIPATGHVWNTDYTVDKAATCENSGIKAIVCSVCGDVKEGSEIEIPATGHKWGEGIYVTAPTCTTWGEIMYTCLNNSAHEKHSQVLPTGHTWGEWKTVKAATTTTEGVSERVCSKCGTKETKAIAKVVLTAAEKAKIVEETTQKEVAQTLPAGKSDADPKSSTYALLQVKQKKVAKTSIKITWNKVSDASTYVIYGNKCGSAYTKLTKVTGTSYTQKGLKKGTYYKYVVYAVKSDGSVIASSKTLHITTSGGKYGNNTKVTLNKKKTTIKKGKTFKLKATAKKGKLKVKNHRKIKYESTNTKIATVSASGKIKGISKGTCYVYAYAQNGMSARIKVTVK